MKFNIVNLGQAKTFDVLSDVTLSRICSAVKKFNDWKDWADTSTGDRYRRDAVADIQGIINQTAPSLKNAAISEIRKNCDNSDEILDLIFKPGTSTVPIVPIGSDVATFDAVRNPPQQPPPPPENPPVATGQPGPGRGAFRYRPSVATYWEPPPPPTGSEPPVYEPVNLPPSTPPPQMPQVPTYPSVQTPSGGCWYTPGQGYSYGAYPGSGASKVELNQSDCNAIISRDRDIRGLPPIDATTAPQFGGFQQAAPGMQSYAPQVAQPGGRPDVASTPCPPGQFWDGRKCRGSVDASASSLINAAGSLGPSGSGQTFSGINSDFNGFSNTGGIQSFTMGRRIPIMNL